MTREEGIGAWARGIAPNTVRAILMNMSQLARYVPPPSLIPYSYETLLGT